jgi:adenosine deaminase
MIDAGLRVVLNSDDPPMLHTDLNQEFAKAITNWGLNGAQVVDLMTNAVDAAWLDDVDRSDLRSSIEPALAPLRS